MKINKRPKGFTLMELLAVLAIIGILVALILPNVLRGISDGQGTQCLSNLRTINTSAIMCFSETRNWTGCGSGGIGDLTNYFPNATAPVCPFGVAYAMVHGSDGVSWIADPTSHFAIVANPALPHCGTTGAAC